MLKYSMKTLGLFVAASSVSLTLTQMNFVISSYVLVAILVIAVVVFPKNTRRGIAWGTVLGIIACFFFMLCYEYLVRGKLGVSNYQESFESREIILAWRPYVIHVGGLLGATIGVLLAEMRRDKT